MKRFRINFKFLRNLFSFRLFFYKGVFLFNKFLKICIKKYKFKNKFMKDLLEKNHEDDPLKSPSIQQTNSNNIRKKNINLIDKKKNQNIKNEEIKKKKKKK